MSSETEWWHFKAQEQAEAAAAEITALGAGYLCQTGHAGSDTVAAPGIGLRDDPAWRWVLVIAYDGDSLEYHWAPKIAEDHGGEFDAHEYTLPVPEELFGRPEAAEWLRWNLELDMPVVGCEECITRLVGGTVPGADLSDLADRAADAGFQAVPDVLPSPDEVILVLACPHAVRETGPGGRSPDA
jgi:hypothetical protein